MVDSESRSSSSDRRAELVSAAAEVINERGVDGTRLSDVAERTGVSVSLIQYYFKTREALIREAFEIAVVGGFEGMLETQQQIEDPWQRIEAIVAELVAPGEPVKEARNWLDLCAAAARQPELRPTVRDVQDRWVQLLAHAIEDGARQGRLNPSLPAIEIATAINAMCDGMVVVLASDAPGANRPDALELRNVVLRNAKTLLRAGEADALAGPGHDIAATG